MRLSGLMGPLWRLFGMLALGFYGIFGPRLFSRRYFEYRYRWRSDPWSYESSPYEQRKYQKTLEILPRRRYKRALEIGCSIGVFTEKLAEEGLAAEIVGVDLSQTALTRARERLGRFEAVQLCLLDITRDPIEGSYDLIFCAEVLFYLGLKNVQYVREKLVAALRGGGHLVLVNPWPMARRLHQGFSESPELQLVKEHLERDRSRPYVVALFEKRIRQGGS
jgi:SAM-dependent methyltransferase